MLFDRTQTVAPPGYSRWMVPPAALAVHLSIGQAYAFSPFNLPMTRLLGGTADDWSLVELAACRSGVTGHSVCTGVD